MELVDELLSVDEAAMSLGIARQTLYIWAMKRKIATVKVGRLLKIKASEVERVIRDGERPRV